MDTRYQKLAELLVRHSCQVKPGEHLLLELFDAPEAMAVAMVEATRAAGGRVIAVGTTSVRVLESLRLPPSAGEFETRLMIAPGHAFSLLDGLLTNFHLPRSTLFMLVSAMSGLDRMRAAYAHAVARRYRFYSYGDACLLSPAEQARQGGG